MMQMVDISTDMIRTINKVMQFFKVGDKIKFQVDKNGCPRWDDGEEIGLEPYPWVEGEVFDVIELPNNPLTVNTYWAVEGKPECWYWTITPAFLAQEGYIRLVEGK